MSIFANILPAVLGSVYAPVKPDVPSNLLLQKYKDAAFAVSLRKLNANYLGNGLRIRRSTDNIEVNVAFDGQNKISTSSSIYNVDDEPTYEVSDDVNWTAVSGGAGYTNLSRSSLTLSSTYSTPYRIKLVFDATLSAGTKVTFGTYVSSISGSNWKVYPAQSDNSLAVSSATTLVSGSQGSTFTLTADATHFILENTSGTESISASGMTLNGSRGDTAATTLGQFISEVGSPPDMHVVTWYDQSGAGNDFFNLTSSTQPKIVDYGSYLGYIDFDANTQNLGVSISNISGVFSFHQVLASQNSAAFNLVGWQGDFNNTWYFASNAFTAATNTGAGGTAVTLGQFNQFSVGVGGVLEELVITKNDSPYASTSGIIIPPTDVTSLTLGNGSAITLASEFKIKELVYLGTDTTANNSAVAQNQIAYWGTPN